MLTHIERQRLSKLLIKANNNVYSSCYRLAMLYLPMCQPPPKGYIEEAKQEVVKALRPLEVAECFTLLRKL